MKRNILVVAAMLAVGLSNMVFASGPALLYSTYLGGSLDDQVNAIAVDSAGNIYLAGKTFSTDFPCGTGTTFKTTKDGAVGEDAFVTKISAAGTLLWSIYLGGDGIDIANGIAIDSSEVVYISGSTTSTTFPTVSPHQATKAGGTDVFVTAISASGAGLIYSTYLGSPGEDEGNAIAVDSAGYAYVTGFTTASAAFTITADVHPNTRGASDVFVSKFTPAGVLEHSTVLGGTTVDIGRAIAIDGSDNVYIAGQSFPGDPAFPTSADGFKPTTTGTSDAFVSKINAAFTTLDYSTFVGGSNDEDACGIALDGTNPATLNVYIAGYTNTADDTTFPITGFPRRVGQPIRSAGTDAFVFKLKMSHLGIDDGIYSAYLGGDSDDRAAAIKVDTAGNAYVTGYTTSTDFITVNPIQAGGNIGASMAFVAEIGSTTVSNDPPVFSTYLGGTTAQKGSSIALDSSGNIYAAGWTTSSNFPTAGTFMAHAGAAGTYEGFVTKISATVPLPSVTNVSPTFGSTAGSNTVVITGTSFASVTGAAGVKFGVTNASSYVVNSDTQITAVAPSHVSGLIDIGVTNPIGTSAVVNADHYTYYDLPAITAVSPTFGSTAGGNTVVITGTSFASVTGAAGVKFGVTNASSYVVNSDTQITAVAPAHVSGLIDISVTNPIGTSGTVAADQYTYFDLPAITAVSPTFGSTAGGNTVVITGTSFASVTGAAGVKFGVTNASSYVVNSDTQITAVAPAHVSGLIDISVTNPIGTSGAVAADQYTYFDLPAITAVSPTFGSTAGGNTVVITGTSFASVTGAAGVKFGVTNASSYVVNSDTQITAVAPAHVSGLIDISVTNPIGTSGTVAADQYTYFDLPAITAVSPTFGSTAGGNTVVITGTSFASVTGAAGVKFGVTNASSYVVNSDTQITAVAPAHVSGLIDISVTNPIGTSGAVAADQYTYFDLPAITAVSPTFGSTAGGNTVVITGTSFASITGAAGVKFGVTNASSYVVNSDTQITAVAPAHVSGLIDISVTNPIGTSGAVAADQYTYYDLPAITAVSPTFGSTAGGNTVVITGTSFASVTGAAGVKFGVTNASSYTVDSNTQITAVAPAHVSGLIDIGVTNPIGTSAVVNADHYTYYDLPAITAVSPTFGSTAGGNTVVITGTSFASVTGATGVKFGVTNASSYTVDSNTQITAVAPAHVSGLIDISVTNPIGTSGAVAADQYTYFDLPVITAVSPIFGSTAGGNTVVITGTSFASVTGAAGVKFGVTNASSYVVNSDTQITAVAPSHVSGLIDISVTNPIGTSGTVAADQYTYFDLPAITAVSPTFGSTAGGNTVVITGTSFASVTGAAGVKFGATNASSYTVDSNTQITAVAPAHVSGLIDISVTNPIGTSGAVAADQYTYFDLPVITAVSPIFGSTAGSNTVVITGTSFASVTGAAGVKFGVTNASSYTVDSNTQITAVAPAHVSGLIDIGVTNPIGTSAVVNADHYTYYDLPAITAVSPTFGSTAGGNTVVITGTSFASVTGAIGVKFGATNASSYTVDSNTQITAVAPAHVSGLIDIGVTNPIGTSAVVNADHYTYYDLPAITAVSPTFGSTAGGNTVVITGTSFASITGATGVKFGATNASSYTVDSDTQITAVAPAHVSGLIDISVTNPIGTSGTVAADQYTYFDLPAITAVNPTFGSTAGGNTVVITGTSFASVTGAVGVKFGVTNASSYTVDSDTQITAVAPSHVSGLIDIGVTNPIGTSAVVNADHYTYYDLPSITAVSPTFGSTAGGNAVVITGTSFASITGATGVKFGITNASSYTVNSDTQITAVAPSHVSGLIDIGVTNPIGTSAIVAADHYTYYDLPSITAVSPTFGSTAGGNTVVITGTSFASITGAAGVKFGITNASSYTVDSDTQITAVAPAHVSGLIDIGVTNPIGTSAVVNADHYTYYDLPSITAVSPTFGSTAGSNTVVITGTSFASVTGAAGVKFGVTNASSYTVDSDTQITAVAPAHVSGLIDIGVTNPIGTSAVVNADHYTYYDLPAITAVTPTFGSTAGGNTVVITGTSFASVTGAAGVKFGVTNASSYVVNSDTQITAVAPAHVSGLIDIGVTNPIGTSGIVAADHYTYYDLPAITAVSPTFGSTAGGNTVVITGTSFASVTGAAGVKFGVTNASSYVVNSDTQITAVAPSHVSGLIDIGVTNPIGTSAVVNADHYSYFDLPAITAVTPTFGTIAEGATVIITGSGFNGIIGAGSVKFGEVNALSYTVNSDTQITAIAPAHAEGKVHIVATNPIGSSPTSTAAGNHYTYFNIPAKDLNGVKVYPNPWNPAVAPQGIVIDKLTRTAEIKIYTIVGEFVALLNETDGDGKVIWNVKNSENGNAASGIYIAIIKNDREIKKVKIGVER